MCVWRKCSYCERPPGPDPQVGGAPGSQLWDRRGGGGAEGAPRGPRGTREVVRFLVWGEPEEFRGRGFPATPAGRWGLVEPGRRRTQVRELQAPPWGRDLGLWPELLPDASGWLRSRRCSRPAGKTCALRPYLFPASGFDGFPPGVRGCRAFLSDARDLSRERLRKATRGAVEGENGFPPSLAPLSSSPWCLPETGRVCFERRLLKWKLPGLL